MLARMPDADKSAGQGSEANTPTSGALSGDVSTEPLSAESLQAGTRLGRHELLASVAKGGMARVWAARLHGQRGFTKLVAIKTILPDLVRDIEFERMFLDEARIAAQIHHPNVCEIYELGEEGQVLYIAMEWINGDSAVQMLRQDGKAVAIPVRIGAKIVAEACAGLHAAHELVDDEGRPLMVVHRDVSPHNILITADGGVKVTDFGVAKALGQHHATNAGQLKGKLSYMAPEQIEGKIDRRGDVFAAGCVLYELTLGRRPFRGENDGDLLRKLLEGSYPSPKSVNPEYPDALDAIVTRALARDPSFRYQTAEDMQVAIEGWLATSGSVVTRAQIGGILKERRGKVIEQRNEMIKRASAVVQGDVSGSGVNNKGMARIDQTPSRSGGGTSGSGRSDHIASSSTLASNEKPTVSVVLPPLPPAPASKWILVAGAVLLAAGVCVVVAFNARKVPATTIATSVIAVPVPVPVPIPVPSAGFVAPRTSSAVVVDELPDTPIPSASVATATSASSAGRRTPPRGTARAATSTERPEGPALPNPYD